MFRCGLITIHGVGEQGRDYAEPLFRNLRKIRKSEDILFCPVFWQDILDTGGVVVGGSGDDRGGQSGKGCGGWFRTRRAIGGCWYWGLRRFVAAYAGDLIAYESDMADGRVYREVHRRLDQAFEVLMKVNRHMPVYVVGHSLGSVILSNFLWDAQNNDSSGAKKWPVSGQAIIGVNNIECIFTMGSPLPLWFLGCEDGGEPIYVKKWVNIYSKSDVLAVPFRLAGGKLADLPQLEEVDMRIGGILTFWNPLCHIKYWESRRVAEKISEVIDLKVGR